MHWESFSDFLAMGGYGGYVWGSYVVTVVLMAGEVLLTARRHRTLQRQRGLSSRAPNGRTR